jgi:putative ABC transport system permease protein
MRPEHWLYTIPLRLRSLFRWMQADQELDDELRDHLERKTEEYLAQGMTQAEAHRHARLDLGGIEQTKEKCRDARRVNWIQDLGQDLRFGLRMLRKSPGFIAFAILTLALGIGANTTIFSADNAVLFRELPYKDSGRLVQVLQKYFPNPGEDRMPVAPATYFDWQAQSRSFEGFAASRLASLNLSGADQPERIRSAEVSASTFSLLGASPLLGRNFEPSDENGSAPVAILNYDLWQRGFHGDAQIVGRTIRANNHLYTVVGVMPQDFRFPIGWLRSDVEVWTPLALNEDERRSRSAIVLDVIARLRPGVTLAQAQTDMDIVARRLSQQYPETNKDWGANLMPLRDRGISDYRPLFLLVSLAVGLVLLIACANVANMLLARGIQRQRELTTRMAVGASRARLVRQLLTEGVMLSALASLLGVILAHWGIQVIASLAPAVDIPELKTMALNRRVLLFTLGLSVLTGLVFSIFPAFTLSRFSLRDALQEGGRSSGSLRQSRLKTMLVAGELALTLTLLICAGTVGRSFLTYMAIPPGFSPANVLVMKMALPSEKYKEPQQWAEFFRRVEEEIKAIPGVAAAAVGSGAPMEGGGDVLRYDIPGRTAADPKQVRLVEYFRVTEEYFLANGIRLKRGRLFDARDRSGTAPVAILNEEFARGEFAGKDPLGEWITLRGDVNRSVNGEGGGRRVQVVGVVNNTKEYGLFHMTPRMVYVPLSQDPARSMSVMVKSAGDPSGLAAEIRRRLLKIDPDQPLFNVRTESQIVRENHALLRLNVWLFGTFAATALILAITGIYALIAYGVSARIQEFGIRLALGATPRQILRLVLRQAASLTSVGIVLGLLLAVPATKLLARALKSSMFVDLLGSGPPLFAAISAGTVIVAFLAAFIAARRATRVDPMVALRYE